MKTEYQDKALTVYDEWIKKVELIVKHKYDMNLDDYRPKYNFKQMYQDGRQPIQLARILAKEELDID